MGSVLTFSRYLYIQLRTRFTFELRPQGLKPLSLSLSLSLVYHPEMFVACRNLPYYPEYFSVKRKQGKPTPTQVLQG